MSSLVRQNYHEECEAGINKQINLELYASYVYMSMVRLRLLESLTLFRRFKLTLLVALQAYHFDRDDVALPGFHKFMLKQSDEEREHAQKVGT